MNEIKVETILKDAWEAFSKGWQPLVIASAIITFGGGILMGIGYLIMLGMSATQDPNMAGLLIASVIVTIALLGIQMASMGLIKMSNMIYEGKEVKYSDIWLDKDTYLKLFGISILVCIGVILGCLLCYFPGLIVGLFCILSFNIAIENNQIGAFEAIKKSASLVKANFKVVLLSILVLWAINTVLGSTGVGAIVSLPAHSLVVTALYRRISNKEDLSNVNPYMG